MHASIFNQLPHGAACRAHRRIDPASGPELLQPSVSRLLALRAAAAPADTGVAGASSSAAATPPLPAPPPRQAKSMSRSAPIGLRKDVPCDSRFIVEDLQVDTAGGFTAPDNPRWPDCKFVVSGMDVGSMQHT
jgi:hypothetical protein